ncbi:MAG: ribonuclease H-like domain-containing protein [Lachnospiraceae bacterium]
MKTFVTDLGTLCPAYPVENLADKSSVLFLDIETTGFTARNSNLYLIGAVYYSEEEWHTIQWFAEKYAEELQLLTAFFDFASNYKFLIHYNGNQFDIPYLLGKCQQYELASNFDAFSGIDIYRRINPYRDILSLSDLKQKTIEEFLGLNREDPFSGRELISKYHDFVCSGDETLSHEILLHNEEDLKGMLKIIEVLAYADLFHKNIRVMKAQASYYQNASQKRCQEIIMKLKLETPLPVPFSFRGAGCYFSGSGQEGSLKVPLYEEEMKYFYSNYKNYYYLPAEDVAMHKSVATFVDKEHRIQATAANCYTRKKSLFLPQWDTVFTPFFKRDYRSKELFFELTDDFKRSRSGFSMYASHVLQAMLKNC